MTSESYTGESATDWIDLTVKWVGPIIVCRVEPRGPHLSTAAKAKKVHLQSHVTPRVPFPDILPTLSKNHYKVNGGGEETGNLRGKVGFFELSIVLTGNAILQKLLQTEKLKAYLLSY